MSNGLLAKKYLSLDNIVSCVQNCHKKIPDRLKFVHKIKIDSF